MNKYVVNGNISVCNGADADVWRGNIDGDADAGVKFLGGGAERPMSLMTLVSSQPHPQLLAPHLPPPASLTCLTPLSVPALLPSS
jgi:hypothetical protein